VLAAFSVKRAAIDCASLAGPTADKPKKKPFGKETPLFSNLPLAGLTITRLRTGGQTDKQKPGAWRIAAIADAVAPREAVESTGKPDDSTKRLGHDAATSTTGNNQVETVQAGQVDLNTAIGRLKVARLPLDRNTAPAAATSKDGKDNAKLAAERRFDAFGGAALGDRSGVASNSFFLVADEDENAGLELLRLFADVELQEADTALPDTRDSSLTFDKTHFRLTYASGQKLPAFPLDEIPWATPGGFLALGKSAFGSEAARIDLGRAALAARRDLDLADLRRQVVDVLEHRSADGTAKWLRQHPNVAFIGRDRCGLYAQGGRDGAPQA
jgi:hypothetical protein